MEAAGSDHNLTKTKINSEGTKWPFIFTSNSIFELSEQGSAQKNRFAATEQFFFECNFPSRPRLASRPSALDPNSRPCPPNKHSGWAKPKKSDPNYALNQNLRSALANEPTKFGSALSAKPRVRVRTLAPPSWTDTGALKFGSELCSRNKIRVQT
jgi:hypothetical protein